MPRVTRVPTVTSSLGRGTGQRPEQQRVGQAEHGDVGAGAEGNRDDGDGREARILGEDARAMAHILPEAGGPRQARQSDRLSIV